MVKGQFIRPDDSRWAAFLEGTPHDVYHLPEYLRFSADQEGGEACAFLCEVDGARFLAPLLLRRLPKALGAPPEWRDAVTPYGYPSPLAMGEVGAEQVESFLTTFTREATAVGVISAFFRLHPLLPLPDEGWALTGVRDVVEHGDTVAVDLSLPPDVLRSQMRGNHRTGINRLRRNGFTVRVDDWSLFSDFRRIYAATMQRLGADQFYLFSDEYFDGLRAALGDRLHLVAVLAPSGEVACAGIFPAVGGIVEYHLGGTESAFLSVAPSKLMFDGVIHWAREAGLRWLHLGGGVGGARDSLFAFKAGFSPVHVPFRTLRMVLHAERYTELNHRRKQMAGGGETTQGFFPEYRFGLGVA